MVSSIDIKEKAKTIEKSHNLNHYEILQRYMFERILERISVSKYQDNFILKGGLLLSAMFGIDNRTTKDMDTTITGIDVSKEKMVKVLNEILSIKLGDGVKFDLVDITNIRDEDEYGGNKYHIVSRKDNLKINLEIDISTGDRVTPRELKFNYPLLFEDKTILINTYNVETILSEKVETILRRGKFNSRMKDFYDVYYSLTKSKSEINITILKKAMENTFNKRGSFEYLNDYEQILNGIIEREKINKLWQKYSNKYSYANGIDIKYILDLLKSFMKEIDLKFVVA